jgi:DNA-binding CsgD family transcriptional regulator/PAS domain-containing protein
MLGGQLRRLLPKVYQINRGSGDWASRLTEIGEYLEADAVALISHDFLRNRGFIYHAIGYNQEYLSSYTLQFSYENPWLLRESDYRPPGKMHVGEELVSEAKLVRTRLYTDWLEPQNLHHRLCAVLSRDRDTAVLLEVMRSRDGGRFTQDKIDACRLLVPHLQGLLRMQQRIAELESERDAALDALDYLRWGVLLVDNHGSRLAANRRAQEILVARDGLMAQGEDVRAVLADDSARLDRLLISAIKGGGGRRSGALSITRPLKAHPLNVVVIPLRTRSKELADRVPAAAIFMSDPDMRINGNEQHLRELYALTPVEARLATHLSCGRSVEEAAAEMGVTVNTARAYLKRIYSKLGVRRQSELVRRLLLGLAGLRLHREETDL